MERQQAPVRWLEDTQRGTGITTTTTIIVGSSCATQLRHQEDERAGGERQASTQQQARVGWIEWGTRDLGLHSSETVPLSPRVLVMFGNVSPGSRKYCALSKAGDRFSRRKHSLALCNASLIRYLVLLSERNASRNLVTFELFSMNFKILLLR